MSETKPMKKCIKISEKPKEIIAPKTPGWKPPEGFKVVKGKVVIDKNWVDPKKK